MLQKTLNQQLSVSALGLGCMGMSEFYGESDDDQSLKVLQNAFELGIDFFDTADMYGPHHNETLLGHFIASSGAVRDNIKIASKFGIVRNSGEYARSINNSPAYAKASCEASLKRLGIEQIDLYYVHRIDKNQPIEETMDGLAALVKEGKIANIGLCEVSAETLKRAHAVYPVCAVQSEYSLWSREPEKEVLPLCRELGIGFVAYSPLGRGFLTNRFPSSDAFAEGDFRQNLPRFSKENMQKNQKILDAVNQFASQKSCTAAQIALAWIHGQGDHIVPIPGTRSQKYLLENVNALKVDLSAGELQKLSNMMDRLTVSGERYTAEGMKGVNA